MLSEYHHGFHQLQSQSLDQGATKNEKTISSSRQKTNNLSALQSTLLHESTYNAI